MANSADDNSTPNRILDEESEVIDLTDEVEGRRAREQSSLARSVEMSADQAGPDGQVMEDELDALTREMPKFRIPDSSEPSGSDPAPGAAIISGRRRSNTSKFAEQPGDDQITEHQDASAHPPRNDGEPEDDGGDDLQSAIAENAPPAGDIDPQVDADPDSQDDFDHLDLENEGLSPITDLPDDEIIPLGALSPGEQTPTVRTRPLPADADESFADYDRQAVVKTIQMDAVDRDALERQFYAERLRRAPLLTDHRFAPAILIRSPRLLTTRWQDGSPLARVVDISADISLEQVEEPVQTLDVGDLESWPMEEDDETVERAPLDRPAAADVDEPSESGAREVVQELDDESMMELDVDALELEPEDLDAPKPPPQPAVPPTPRSAEPARPRARTTTPSPPRSTPQSAQAEEEEAELGNLVRNLLDETPKSEEPGAAQRPKRAAPNRPRSPRDTWCQQVFSEEYLRTLPRGIHLQTRREVGFIEHSLGLKGGERILDLACGFGRHAIELTRRGHEVVGLDLSLPLLQKALHEAQRQSLSIKFIHGDMRDLKFDGIFDACFLWQTSFGYFEDQTNFRVLRGIHRALKPGGCLLIDVLNRDHIVAQMPHRIWWEGVNCVFLEEVEFDYRASVLHTKRSFIYEDGTPPLEQNSYIRLYSAHELGQILHAAGFGVAELSGELHHRGEFLGPSSTRIIVKAHKRSVKNG